MSATYRQPAERAGQPSLVLWPMLQRGLVIIALVLVAGPLALFLTVWSRTTTVACVAAGDGWMCAVEETTLVAHEEWLVHIPSRGARLTIEGDPDGRGDLALFVLVPDGAPLRLTSDFTQDKAGQIALAGTLDHHFEACAVTGACPPVAGAFGLRWTLALVPALGLVAAAFLLVLQSQRVVVSFDVEHRLVVVTRRWPLRRPWSTSFDAREGVALHTVVDARRHPWVAATRADGTTQSLFRTGDAPRDLERLRAWAAEVDVVPFARPSSEPGRR